MTCNSVTIRIHNDAYRVLNELAKSDRRTMIDTLDLLLLEVDKTTIEKLAVITAKVKS